MLQAAEHSLFLWLQWEGNTHLLLAGSRFHTRKSQCILQTAII